MAPRVLSEYLSNPVEVVGVEHMLSSQKTTRENLKANHARSLMEKQSCHEGFYLEVLKLKLRNSSTIAANMARERAEYVGLLD